jgi:hypothetical protein
MENEVQLRDVFSYLHKAVKGFFSFLNGFISFIFKYFYVALPLIVLAAVVGYYLDSSTTQIKTARIIVSQNFDSVSYLYESIHTIQDLTEAKDQEALEKMGLAGLSDIEINPIIDVNILFNSSLDTRNLEALLNEVPVDKDDKNGTTLTSEAFNSSYKKHEIILQVKDGTAPDIVERLTQLINSNSYYNNVKEQHLDNLSKQIKDEEIIVNQIDSLIKKAYNKSVTTSDLLAAQFSDSDLNSLLNTKKGLVNSIRNNKLQIIISQNTFMVLNKPAFSSNKIKLTEKKIVLLSLFSILLLFLIYVYRKI